MWNDEIIFRDMNELTINELEKISGGGFVDGLCYGLEGASLVMGGGALLNFWNPVGWAAGTLYLAGAACFIREGYKMTQ
jgi:bacteriocin-like protein